MAFSLDTSSVQEIRERADYPGCACESYVGRTVAGIAAWDVSTGEPIAPWPTVTGSSASRSHSGLRARDHHREKVAASSNAASQHRWRDYVDIVNSTAGASTTTGCIGQNGRNTAAYSRPVAPHLARLWRSRTGEMGDTDAASTVGDVERPMSGRRNMGSAGRKNKFGNGQRSRRHSTALAALGHRTGELHLGTARRVPATRCRWISKRESARRLSWHDDGHVIGLARVIAVAIQRQGDHRHCADEPLYALRTPLASATWSLAPANLTRHRRNCPRSGWAAIAFADSVG